MFDSNDRFVFSLIALYFSSPVFKASNYAANYLDWEGMHTDIHRIIKWRTD